MYQLDTADYGNPIIGIWNCSGADCGFFCYPVDLQEKHAVPPFLCPECGAELEYDEEE